MALAATNDARVKRQEDPRLITGSEQYTADLALPNRRHGACVQPVGL